ncbi:MAG: NUDIX hydrolase [Candidatus Sungiibacteriota bacterium]|uniref:NUDIX hydrolase n=1 Tax=Candidatus Sungiibacteriota bacterium TaxID=2750080 RepID=A0A7T5RKD4_9BACT|nr:MAG: NUDIX hydrolase [Candidatus Sungbacteria bacterium]
MPKICDNKSVGILVWNKGELLMIERRKYNFGFAIPAGHQDGDDPETIAKKELFEEVGLKTGGLEKKLEIGLPNPCKREGGAQHDWTVFEANGWTGEIKPSQDETKSYFWADRKRIIELAERLQEFAKSQGISLSPDGHDLPRLVEASNTDPAWRENPGLEPPMYFLFKELGIL